MQTDSDMDIPVNLRNYRLVKSKGNPNGTPEIWQDEMIAWGSI